MGLAGSSYEAYCFDEAVILFGLWLEAELDKAGHKPSKQERRAQQARERLLKKVMGDKESGTGFADPAAMFQ